MFANWWNFNNVIKTLFHVSTKLRKQEYRHDYIARASQKLTCLHFCFVKRHAWHLDVIWRSNGSGFPKSTCEENEPSYADRGHYRCHFNGPNQQSLDLREMENEFLENLIETSEHQALSGYPVNAG